MNGTVTTDPRAAAAALLDGHLVVLPTETVYGLAGRADDAAAVERIYDVKGRPTEHPLIVHIADAAAAIGSGPQAWAMSAPRWAQALAAECWPGPLTLVLPRGARAMDAVTGGQPTVALRVPGHPLALATLQAMDEIDPAGAPHGIAAPSANRFGGVSPTDVAHVLHDLPGLTADDLALDGGACTVGVESTIVDATGPTPRILRPGGVDAAAVQRITGLPAAAATDSTVRAPGMLPSHYAPRAVVILADTAADLTPLLDVARRPIGLLAAQSIETPEGVRRLAAPRDDAEYARQMYAALRAADAEGMATVIAVPPEVDTGLRDAVLDRLHRAAAPRS